MNRWGENQEKAFLQTGLLIRKRCNKILRREVQGIRGNHNFPFDIRNLSQRNGYHTTIKMMESVLGDVKLLVMWTRKPLGRFIPKLLTNLL